MSLELHVMSDILLYYCLELAVLLDNKTYYYHLLNSLS